MENEYLLRIDFKKETENPERVFSAMSELIQALREIDRSLSASISTEIETKLILEDVEAGSIIAKGGEGVKSLSLNLWGFGIHGKNLGGSIKG